MVLIAFVKTIVQNCPQNHIIMSFALIGALLRDRRKQLGLTQPHLAELAGLSVNTLYKLERGQSNPTWEVVHKLAEVLGMEITVKVKTQ